MQDRKTLRKSLRMERPIRRNIYSRTPEIETADLSQTHASLNLSQF